MSSESGGASPSTSVSSKASSTSSKSSKSSSSSDSNRGTTDSAMETFTPDEVSDMINSTLYDDAILSLESDGGMALLAGARAAGTSGYHHMAPYFVKQEKNTWCGLASLAVTLGALTEQPLTQRDVLDRGLTPALRRNHNDHGMTLDELRRIAEQMGFVANTHRTDGANPSPSEVAMWLRQDCRRFFSEDGLQGCIIINMCRLIRTGKKETSLYGHITPIAAYDADTDMILIHEVAAHRFTPHWVSVSLLALLTCRVDSGTKRARGYVTIERTA